MNGEEQSKEARRIDFLKSTLEQIDSGYLPYNNQAQKLVLEWIEELENKGES